MTSPADIPVGDPLAPLGDDHVTAHQQIVDYLVELTERVAALEAAAGLAAEHG